MQIVNQPQADFWTSPAGRAWIEHEGSLDATMKGVLDVLLDAAALSGKARVLDVGCGTGASTIAAARMVPEGTVLGLDIAAPMLDRARMRALEQGVTNASFRLCDAQVEALSRTGHDVLISRFGMSFFDDSVAAFRNLATALRDGGRMVFVSWAGLDQNPWFLIPQQVAGRRLAVPPDPPSGAPGPLAFADAAHVLDLMDQASLTDGRAETRLIDLTPPGGVTGAAHLATHVGPAARLLRLCNATPADRAAIAAAIEQDFAAFDQGAGVRIPSAVHVFSCRVRRQG
ncbi:methyltransferase domain-containing protein [Paracoccus sp. YIM 132242]|uniref:Methyltransferase domain-containing protein n=1 Tax=Paracoccus lichenicola TaxID=2665644 RepID=A0A6L6HNX1_9RHOB|nr:class I SAM-dependent methyltransferase [Paracoccus lichenicola]MTD98997.1 methyltransferase domain-containing protein [Paracoccus lichenicola]